MFGHHFAAIAGPGPLVGPTLAAQFGYLPGTLWIILGVVLGGAVQDFVILFCSVRRDGKSLGQMAREEIGKIGGGTALITVLLIMVILLAVIGLVVVNALKGSPWGTFTIAATMPIAVFMGLYLRYWRPGQGAGSFGDRVRAGGGEHLRRRVGGASCRRSGRCSRWAGWRWRSR
ncbi:MAG: carbon starvation CstA family protein [Paludibaculum sp.]